MTPLGLTITIFLGVCLYFAATLMAMRREKYDAYQAGRDMARDVLARLSDAERESEASHLWHLTDGANNTQAWEYQFDRGVRDELAAHGYTGDEQ